MRPGTYTVDNRSRAIASCGDPRESGKMTGICPDVHGGNNFWPASYSQKTGFVYIPGNESCVTITPDTSQHVRGKFTGGGYVNEERVTSRLTMIDPATGELKKFKDLPYANLSGVLATGSNPSEISRSLISGSAIASVISRCNSRTRQSRLEELLILSIPCGC